MQKKLVILSIFFILIGTGSFAQKGLYIGAGIGSAGQGGDLGKEYDAGGGAHFLLGFKITEKTGLELEYGGYEQKLKEENPLIEKAYFANLALNFKYFFGEAEPRTFRPYLSTGLAVSALGWDYSEAGKAILQQDKDGVGALSLVPGLGFELMLGRIAAFNASGRLSLNGWGEETETGTKLDEKPQGNTLLINLGLILHL